ncbi:stage 0 sporulation family protein [Acidobacteriota bacterium]
MSEIICVNSQRLGRVFRAKKEGVELKKGDRCIVEVDLGEELVVVIHSPRSACEMSNSSQDAVKILRKATIEDEDKFNQLQKDEETAYEFCLEKIKARNLPMKLVRVRYFSDEKKGIFYYTADGRVDFRQLVKDLAKEFRMRIEMRQIGVRDEAKMIGGLGVCGRHLCCASFMKSFEPVTIQKAKKQKIAINPTKISGLCGRLMCCLAFEDESRGRLYSEEEKIVED